MSTQVSTIIFVLSLSHSKLLSHILQVLYRFNVLMEIKVRRANKTCPYVITLNSWQKRRQNVIGWSCPIQIKNSRYIEELMNGKVFQKSFFQNYFSTCELSRYTKKWNLKCMLPWLLFGSCTCQEVRDNIFRKISLCFWESVWKVQSKTIRWYVC